MNDKISWGKIGVAAAIAVVAAGALGTVVAVRAQTRRAPAIELRSLVAGGPELGVSIRDVSEADAKAAQLTSPAGAYVESVRTESPAAKAGIQAADVIVTYDGERVRGSAHLRRLVDETPAGRTVDVILQRAGRRVTVSVAPAERIAGVGAAPRALLAPNLRSELLEEFNFDRTLPFMRLEAGRLGVAAESMSDQLRDYFGVTGGVLVSSVSPGTPAATAGVRAGDVITSIGGTTVQTVADLRRVVTTASGDVALVVTRDKKSVTLTVKFPVRERQERTSTNPTI